MDSGELLLGGHVPDGLALRVRYRDSIGSHGIGPGQVDCSNAGWSVNVGDSLTIGKMDWDQYGEVIAEVFGSGEPIADQARDLGSCRRLVGTQVQGVAGVWSVPPATMFIRISSIERLGPLWVSNSKPLVTVSQIRSAAYSAFVASVEGRSVSLTADPMPPTEALLLSGSDDTQ